MSLVATFSVFGFLAGCGGGTDADTTQTAKKQATGAPIGLPLIVHSKLSKEEYLKRANEVCRRSWADMRKQFAFYRARWGSGKYADRGPLYNYMSQNVFLPHMQFWFDDISYLGSPKGERIELEDMLKVLQIAVFSGEEQKMPSPRIYVAVLSSFSRMARDYGLKDCVVSEDSFQPRSS